jgi:DinB superfamily
LIEELRDYCDQIDNIKEDAEELSAPLNNGQFNWRSAAGRWSISECLAHLNVVDGQDIPSIEAAIERARNAGLLGNGPFRYGWLSRKFVQMNEPPVKLKIKAPKLYVPPPDQPKEKVIVEFVAIHDRLKELIRSANGLDLARIKVPTPLGKLVTFSLGQRFALITAHDRRHLWQAWQARKHPGFPEA